MNGPCPSAQHNAGVADTIISIENHRSASIPPLREAVCFPSVPLLLGPLHIGGGSEDLPHHTHCLCHHGWLDLGWILALS